ncbi:MAG: hypothetical protein D6744_10750, partial [Planctomycetota bacterium]
ACVEEVEIATPDDVQRLRFLGSPTVQVDGVDIEPAARSRTDYVMSCRLYDTPDGLPSRAVLLAALGVDPPEHGEAGSATGRTAEGNPDCCGRGGSRAADDQVARTTANRAGMLAIGGSIAAALLSSACCWIPLLLLALGASAAGVAAVFAPWRPVFIVAATALLGLGFYFAYMRRQAPATACCTAKTTNNRRFQRATFWASAVMVAAFVFFPQYASLLPSRSTPAIATASESGEVARDFRFDVAGMHCEACALTLQSALAKIDGVRDVHVDYAGKIAHVAAVDGSVVSRVIEATKNAGFKATLRADSP